MRLSVIQLSFILGISPIEVENALCELGYLERTSEKTSLTEKGREYGVVEQGDVNRGMNRRTIKWDKRVYGKLKDVFVF